MGHHPSAEAAMWAFFTTFNERSASGRAATMTYPHVRDSAARAEPSITDTSAEFEANASWESVDRTGWAVTQPITPRVVQRMSSKVHFAGGWTRLRADGSEIARNRLLYVAAKTEDGWGIQAGFGVEGALDGEAAAEPTAKALAVIDRTMETLASGDVDAWLDCFHYPNVLVLGPGQLERYETREGMDAAYREWAASALPVEHTSTVTAAGPSAAIVAQDITHGGFFFQQCFFVVERNGRWATAAVTAVRPNE